MATFNYHQDVKETIWRRESFTIEADTKEEADEIARQMTMNNEISSDNDGNDGVEFIESEILFDTEEFILPSENGGEATIELYDDDDELMVTNKDE